MMKMKMSEKTKGVGLMPGDTVDGHPMPDRYYARLQYGHLGIYATLEEAVHARRMAEKGDLANGTH